MLTEKEIERLKAKASDSQRRLYLGSFARLVEAAALRKAARDGFFDSYPNARLLLRQMAAEAAKGARDAK